MSRTPSIRTGLTADEIKQAFREHLHSGLGRPEQVSTIRDYCDRVWNIKPGQ
jgi:hypothetical protein